MASRWVIVAVVGACGGGGSARDKQLCEHAATLCDAQDEASSCPGELAEARKNMGGKYDAFVECGLAAKTCGEYVGCALGGLGGEVLDQVEGLEQGMGKMLDKHKSRFARDGEALLGPCTRIEKVCSPDKPFIRKECNAMVQNLGEDTANLSVLASCINSAKNCFALEKCVDELEQKLRGY